MKRICAALLVAAPLATAPATAQTDRAEVQSTVPLGSRYGDAQIWMRYLGGI